MHICMHACPVILAGFALLCYILQQCQGISNSELSLSEFTASIIDLSQAGVELHSKGNIQIESYAVNLANYLRSELRKLSHILSQVIWLIFFIFNISSLKTLLKISPSGFLMFVCCWLYKVLGDQGHGFAGTVLAIQHEKLNLYTHHLYVSPVWWCIPAIQVLR